MFGLKKAYVTRTLKRNALRKGLLGGSPFWRAIWAGQLLLKGWGKVSKSGDAPIVFTESLKQGEAWTLVHAPEKTRKKRRQFLSTPSAERINEILGPDRVTPPPPTRREVRATKKQQKSDVKQTKKAEKEIHRVSAPSEP